MSEVSSISASTTGVPSEMRRIERVTGFDDWTDPQLSAIYWGVRGRCKDIVAQSTAIYRKRHGGG